MNARSFILSARRLSLLLAALLACPACALFEEIKISGNDADTDTGAKDYWDDGRCPFHRDEETGESRETVVSQDCRGIADEGCCDGEGNALYCHPETNKLMCAPCGSSRDTPNCAWTTESTAIGDISYYWCSPEDDSADTKGVHPRSCEQVVHDALGCHKRRPQTCEDIHPTDTDQQIFGCCDGGKAYTCQKGKLTINACSKDQVCAYQGELVPNGAACIAKPGPYTTPFNPRNCGKIPATCDDISTFELEQYVGCCANNRVYRCALTLPGDTDTADDEKRVPQVESCTGGLACAPSYINFDPDNEDMITALMFCR